MDGQSSPKNDGARAGVIQSISYYLADGTQVQVMRDGTEVHHPPEDESSGAGRVTPSEQIFDPNARDAHQELYPLQQYYEQS
jgi:hypothetical protein